MNKLREKKLFALFVAISSVIIIAGIVLYAILGFNVQPKPDTKVIDLTYGTTVVNGKIGDKDASAVLEEKAEAILKDAGLSYERTDLEAGALSSQSIGANGQQHAVRYTFSSSVKDADLEAAVTAIKAFTDTEPTVLAEADISVAWHTVEDFSFKKAAWRGAIAIAVGAIVALIYVTVRFGVSNGVAGLVVAAHDALFTAAFFALTRIPVFSFAPVLYAAIAAFVSVAVWTVICIKQRSIAKENADIHADELIGKTLDASWKYVACIAAALALIVVVFGLVAVAGTRALVLPAIVACLVPVYSTLLIAPNIFLPIRRAFDKKRDAKKGGYVRKKKKAELEAEE